ncbi:MAG: bifunctional DNA primase/polymerase [Proteobacteria bacterium]|nr:bifunctional DNA primase/polymerase [Pseudomonadota bacterium]
MAYINNSANKGKSRFVSALHQTAHEYAANGIPVFICHPESKAPATEHGYKDATTDLDQIAAWFARCPSYNIAISPEHAKWSVVDVERAGLDAWQAIQAEHGAVKTYSVATPHGGRHFYFSGSLPSRVRLWKGLAIDTRGRGGYVLVPPSRVVYEDGSSGVYEVADDCDVADVPHWLIQAAERHVADVITAPSGADPDDPGNIDRMASYLKGLAKQGMVAIEGAGGNDTTFKLAAEILDQLRPDTAFRLLLEHWNPRCQPPWDVEDLAVIVGNAVNYKQNAIGATTVARASDVFADVVAKFPSDTPRMTGEIIPFAALLKRDVPPVQELVPGLIEKGIVTFLAGHGGTHKSRTSVHWGLSIAAGRPIYGREVERASFVCISCEDGIDEVTRRVQAMAQRLDLPIGDNAYLWDRRGLVAPLATVSDGGIKLEPFWGELQARLKSISGHKFIVVDSAYNVLNFTGATKSNEGAVKAAIEILGQLCAETDSTMVVLWHPSQAGQERGDNSGWSVAWHNAPRARLSLTRVPDTESAFDLKVEKRNNAPPQKLPLTLRWDDGVLLPITEVAATERKALFKNACINTALQAADGGCPIQKQRRIQGWMFDQIEKDAGYRPTEKQVKDELAAAISTGELRYIAAHGKQQAGYFAKERDPFLIKNRIPEAKHPG